MPLVFMSLLWGEFSFSESNGWHKKYIGDFFLNSITNNVAQLEKGCNIFSTSFCVTPRPQFMTIFKFITIIIFTILTIRNPNYDLPWSSKIYCIDNHDNNQHGIKKENWPSICLKPTLRARRSKFAQFLIYWISQSPKGLKLWLVPGIWF